jgi:hypothetical protein
MHNAVQRSDNSKYPAPLRSTQIASFVRNFGYPRDVMRNLKNIFLTENKK